MNEYFGTTMSQQDLQARLAQRRRNNGQRAQSISIMPPGSSNQSQNGNLMGGMMGLRGDSLDDLISQNDMEYRRQSFPRGYVHHEDDRRSSMMDFGQGNVNMNLDDFQFGVTPTAQEPTIRRQSVSGMDMGGYQNMGSSMNMSGHQMMYSSPMEQSNPNGLLLDSPADRFTGLSADMVNDMMGYNQMMMDGITQDEPSMSLYPTPNYSQDFGNGNMDMMSNDFLMSQNIPASTQQINDNGIREENNNNIMPNLTGIGVQERPSVQIPTSMNMNTSMGIYSSPITANKAPPAVSRADSSFSLPPSAPATAAQTPAAESAIKAEANYQGIYSSSGFDMLGLLMKVVTRPKPEINIGKVDMSCAFVVCDVTMPDCPIVYVSDIFERLTGYSKFEVTGQNCRFLQSPEGKVEAGLRREFVDNDSVYYLKKRILEKKEAQRSLINYRKGGQPFMNLLTMIPICGDDSDEIKYFVGFQVDLVEKPTSVEGKNALGLYTVDYSQGQLPRYVWQPPDALANRDPGGQTISRDDVSAVLSSVNNHTESELAKRMWDKVLLENTDDVVHVLSLKGLFLYLSPSCRHVLEYDASELVGTALSSVCHPSDIVPVTRELKDTSTGASVNVVYRIRRKKSGYTWFESHGALSVEQGKGRKCIILVGRERPVYALARNDIEDAGGIGESEIWNKLSTSGMFLYVSSNVRTLLDRSPEDLMGTSIQVLMRQESKIEFGRSLEKARTGKRVTYKHEIMNKRGVGLQAQTTLYPGDASEGSKPTFLVAQTRLLKNSSRTIAQPGSAHTGSTHTGSSKSLSLVLFPQNPSLGSTPSVPSQPDTDPAQPPPMVGIGIITQPGGGGLAIGTQDVALASEDNIFDELKTTRCTSWQFELRQMEKSNRLLSEELAVLLSNKKKRKRRKGAGPLQRDCANCHTRTTPEWRRGPSGQRDLCNSCGLRWAKQTGRVSPRNSSRSTGDKSPIATSPLHKEITNGSLSNTPNLNPNPQEAQVDVKGSGGASKPKVLGGRSTVESMPVHEQSVGFRDGGERGITTLIEEGEMG